MARQIDRLGKDDGRTVVKVVSLVLALAGLAACLCGVMIALFPAVGLEDETGTAITYADSAFLAGICFVPAIVLVVAAGAVWLLFGRRS